ncbi:hypothetical protein ZIOFF_049120 [Zingiber officinale]|uniref:Uncharacterized protein n=1 Tax=Zingiber officinale TaxID=94328 RepID=A0A8J5KN59_ZINOF|nr:hypothetical protein ZIOFF_049120 [Zingiber officinale]
MGVRMKDFKSLSQKIVKAVHYISEATYLQCQKGPYSSCNLPADAEQRQAFGKDGLEFNGAWNEILKWNRPTVDASLPCLSFSPLPRGQNMHFFHGPSGSHRQAISFQVMFQFVCVCKACCCEETVQLIFESMSPIACASFPLCNGDMGHALLSSNRSRELEVEKSSQEVELRASMDCSYASIMLKAFMGKAMGLSDAELEARGTEIIDLTGTTLSSITTPEPTIVHPGAGHSMSASKARESSAQRSTPVGVMPVGLPLAPIPSEDWGIPLRITRKRHCSPRSDRHPSPSPP